MTEPAVAPRGVLQRWNVLPLYLRILAAMAAGVVAGLLLGEHAEVMEIPSKIILQLLGALAPPLILIAVIHVLMTTEVRGKLAARLAFLLLLNTTVAIVIGLAVANVLQPGGWTEFTPPKKPAAGTAGKGPLELLVQNVPHSILGPLGDRQNIIGVILIAVAFGVALRGVRAKRIDTVQNVVEVAYEVLLIVLHWIINLVPIGVFAIVANVVGVQRLRPVQGDGGVRAGRRAGAAVAGGLVSRPHPPLLLGPPARRVARHARCAVHGVLDRQFHSHHAGDV